MTYEETRERVNQLLNVNNYTEEEKKEIESLSVLVLREQIADCNCQNRWFDALVKMRKYMKGKTDFNRCQYEMQRGASFRMDGKLYVQTNLTDEAAEWFLKNFPQETIVKKIAIATPVGKTETKETAKRGRKSK